MKKFKSFNSIVAGLLAISSLTMCKKREEAKPELSGNDASIQAVTACTYTVETSQWQVDGSAIPAGSVVCIPAGTRGSLLLKNFKGTADKPIIITNKGGKVTIKTATTATYSFKAQNCQNIKVLGNGDPSVKYGIEIDGGNIGMSYEYLSSDIEAAYLEVHNTGFAGIMAKTDPSCDKATWRENFTMRNLNIHDNYVHNTGGEGFYIGNSFYTNGRNLDCGTVMPHSIENAKIYNNITESTGCEGIQVGCAIKGLEVYNNSISNFGVDPFQNFQNNGLQIGEGSGGKCYNNIVKNGPGNGIIVLGLGDNVVYNNIVISPGGNGVFCDERYTPGTFFKFINNTIINPGEDGFKVYSETLDNTLMNNVVINPKSGNYISKLNNSVKIADLNNYFNKDVATCSFINVTGNDYRVNSGSPLIDKGGNASSHGVASDYYGTARPQGSAYDIGATEYKTSIVTPPVVTPPVITPTPTAAISSLTLINANTEKDVATVTNGYVVSQAVVGKSITFRANASSGTKSVVFKLDDKDFRVSNAVPFAFAGYSSGNYYSWVPAVGTYKITAIPYTGTNGTGTKGTEVSYTITVVSNSTTTPTTPTNPTTPTTPSTIAITSYTLVNADTDKDIMTIKNGDIIKYSTLGTKKINIRANINSTSIKSVVFKLNGQTFRTDSGIPFALNSDNSGNYAPWTPNVGTYKLEGIPYSSGGGTGTQGTSLGVTFSILN